MDQAVKCAAGLVAAGILACGTERATGFLNILFYKGEIEMANPEANSKEKKRVAFSSVVASLFLTAGKLFVGFLTGSLGIISEAAHSALDLFAALLTFFAVRVSDKPADKEHQYGHAKIENFSALIEAFLLLITCIWIIKEAVGRLFFNELPVEINVWSFAVLIFSMLIDYSRSRALSRVAKKTNSQALEADALHFSSDIFSSLVVLIGLVFTKFGITYADSLAALAVAVIVILATWRLALKTIDALLDKAPAGLDELVIREVMQIPGVIGVHKLRLRQSGGTVQGDLHVVLGKGISFVDGHKIATEVEKKLSKYGADIVVHFEPQEDLEETEDSIKAATDIIARIMNRKNRIIKDYHELQVNHDQNGINVSMHVVMPRTASIQEASEYCENLRHDIANEIKEANVFFHIEPCDGSCQNCEDKCDDKIGE